jgi:ribosome-interacting GTPase 1
VPANLTPDYLAAEREFKAAETPAEKIAALERMLSTLPKHKGTEKLQADIRRRLAQTRKESHKKGAAHATPFYLIDKEGAGQVALAGPPNAGKSRLLGALTHAHPEVADYPFTTRFPTPGMMAFEDVQIQLLDLPPISPEFSEPWMPQVLRRADATLLIVDINDAAVLDEIDYVAGALPRPPALLVANKIDLPQAEANLEALRDLYGDRYRLLAVSAETGRGLDEFRRAVFDLLGLVRVYTKAPGKKPDLDAPYVLHRGATVQDAAARVHKDFVEGMKFARLFHKEGGRDGMMVERTHLVEDGDILEFHV